MKLETLKIANELIFEINQLKGSLLVIEHISRNDMRFNPPHYTAMDNDQSANHYYVPEEQWLEFLKNEKNRITKELIQKQSYFEKIE